MAQSTLEVTLRGKAGKVGAKKTRNEGNVPGVLYGKGLEAVSISVNPAALKQALSTEAGENTLLDVNYKEGDKNVSRLSILSATQYDFLTNKPLHFDFHALDVSKKITVNVPVKITGKAKGVKEGGILEEILREIPVECLPKDIPNSFEVDVTDLEIGHSIHVAVLKTSDEITLLKDDSEAIVTILAPKLGSAEEGGEGAEEGKEAGGEGQSA
jgi:large subunit ribosomal protein L25